METAIEGRADFLTPKQVAHRLGVDVSSVYRSISRNELPHVRLRPAAPSACQPQPSNHAVDEPTVESHRGKVSQRATAKVA